MKAILIILAVCVVGCSEGVETVNPNSKVTPPPVGSTADPLQAVAFGGNVLQTQTRFISYSKKAGRVSLIDPQNEKELWSKNAKGFDIAIEHPDLNGATLFSQNQLLILTTNSEKTIVLENRYAHIAAAQAQVAYALASEDGQSIEVVRFLGDQQWQHEKFTVPWEAIDPTISSAPAAQPVLLVTQFNHDGTMLMVFRPADGRYAVYVVASTQEPLISSSNSCSGDGVGLPTDATFTSLTWDESYKRFYLGDKIGRIYSLDPIGDCTDFALLPTIKLPSDSPVYRINLYGNGKFGVVQDQVQAFGEIHQLVFDGSNFTLEKSFSINHCAVLLGSINLDTRYIVII